MLGLLVGRWWAVAAAVGVGLWIGIAEEVEIPGWLYGLIAGLIAAGGIIVGVFLRRRLLRSRSLPR